MSLFKSLSVLLTPGKSGLHSRGDLQKLDKQISEFADPRLNAPLPENISGELLGFFGAKIGASDRCRAARRILASPEDFRVKSARKLNPPLPLTRIAAGMKASDDQERIGLDEKKERVGKFLRTRPPESLKDDGKLPGIVGHALHDTGDFAVKAVA
jgi:hypothetical protein